MQNPSPEQLEQILYDIEQEEIQKDSYYNYLQELESQKVKILVYKHE